MPINLLLAFLLSTVAQISQGQTQCTTPSQGKGQCILVSTCPELYKLIVQNTRTQEELNLLRKSHCGYSDGMPMVCCPLPAGGCLTPDGQLGQCVGLYSCPQITQLLSKPPVSAQSTLFVSNSRCDGAAQYSVCCGSSQPLVAPSTPTGQCTPTHNPPNPPNPSTECCGRESQSTDRIIGGNVTAVDQYPWLAIIEYRRNDNNKIKLLCGAVLISGRYVLTAGHCVLGDVLRYHTPVNVRLGEYDTSNEGRDCVPANGGGEDCTKGTVVIAIEQIIPHPLYMPHDQLRRNDIALLRLKTLAPYTEFIRPICLPANDVSTSPPEDFTMYTAGWGAVNSTNSAQVKMHVDLPYINIQQCQLSYNVPRRNVQLWKGQICAGGEKGKDSCKGDSGGPLMYENGRTFEVIGIVSFGPTPCGLEDIPGVYTKVYEYKSWIESHIRP